MSIERITITFEKDGRLRGASSQDFTGELIPVDAAFLSGITPNLAMVSQFSELANSVTTAQAAQSLAESKLAALIAGARTAMEKPTTTERLTAAAALIQAAEETIDEAKAASIRADIAAKQAELSKLED